MEILLAGIGFLIGLTATMAGIGGGVFMVPTIYFLAGDIGSAVGTSKFVIMFLSGLGLLSYHRLGLVRWRLWVCIFSTMLPFSILGAYVVAVSSPFILRIIVGLFILYYSLRLILGWSPRVMGKLKNNCFLGLGAGGLSGIIAGLTGTGGGAVNMPILLGLMGLPIREAAALSISLIFPSAVAAGLMHVFQGLVSPVYAASLIVGAVPGGFLGPHVSARLPVGRLRFLVGLILLVVGVLMVFWRSA